VSAPSTRNASPRIVSVATAVPSSSLPQEQILAVLARHFPSYNKPLARRIFLNAGIDRRNLALSPEQFHPDSSADDMHAVFLKHSQELGKRAACGALRGAGIGPGDIDLIVAATCTGYLCPGLSARLAGQLGMKQNLQRADVVGMGCAGALPSLQRANDFVRAYPDKRALVVTVEISSACWFVDATIETVVGNAICADGAAAAVVAMGDGPGPCLERFETVLETSYIESVGFSFEAGKNRIVLDAKLRHDAGPIVRKAVDNLLEREGLTIEAIDHWVVHAGGRRVLDSIGESLELNNGELGISREVLRTHGNMSSPTVLFALKETLAGSSAGALGVMIALGPGLAAEVALLRW
jgi:predicted naringenin-chalcone synthase